MKYTLIHRNKSTYASSNIEFVKWMRKTDLQHWGSNLEFIQGYSHRKLLFEKIVLSDKDEDSFVEDLLKNNLLKIEKGSKGSFLNFFKF